MKTSFIYVHDPMCSWCWGFEPVRKQLFDAIAAKMEIVRLVGGLAPDSDAPMPDDMQVFLQNTWHKIEQAIPGTRFNYDFWTQCQPRRSTYPSNRAVIAARLQGEKFDGLMTHRIQQAYYTEAKNPSDVSTLCLLAADIGLDVSQFEKDIHSVAVQNLLAQEIAYTRQLGMNTFPSLALQINDRVYPISLDYLNADTMLAQVQQLIAQSS